MNIDKVKAKIRKLLAVASDNSVADGEIAAAMKLAEAAMDKHHLERADVEASAPSDAKVETEYGQATSKPTGARISVWESTLFNAVKRIVGSVDAYTSSTVETSGTFAKSKRQKVLIWYGPAEDARLAADLFEDWTRIISSMAMGKYGSCLRSTGARYANGFATALFQHAKAEAAKRSEIVTPSTQAIVMRSDGSLADMLVKHRKAGKQWLSSTGVHVGASSSRRSAGNRNGGDFDAYAAGKSDGSQSGFAANRQAKLT